MLDAVLGTEDTADKLTCESEKTEINQDASKSMKQVQRS